MVILHKKNIQMSKKNAEEAIKEVVRKKIKGQKVVCLPPSFSQGTGHLF